MKHNQLTYPSPPYSDMDEAWDDQPRQYWRKIRKAVGLPASADVGTISTMLQQLLSLTNSPSSTAIISYPALPGLLHEDIYDAADYVRLYLPDGNHRFPPREAAAAYAGYGMGLCRSFENEKKCRDEGLELPEREVLLIEATETALLLHASILREAYDLGIPVHDTAVSFDLGTGTAGMSSTDDSTQVRDFIIPLLRRRYSHRPRPVKKITVLMTGSVGSVNSPAVRNGVLDALNEVGLEADIRAEQPEFIAARGAAELARRALALKKTPGQGSEELK